MLYNTFKKIDDTHCTALVHSTSNHKQTEQNITMSLPLKHSIIKNAKNMAGSYMESVHCTLEFIVVVLYSIHKEMTTSKKGQWSGQLPQCMNKHYCPWETTAVPNFRNKCHKNACQKLPCYFAMHNHNYSDGNCLLTWFFCEYSRTPR